MKDMLYQKYEVEKREGTFPFQGKYFVLNPNSDPFARLALLHYASICEEEFPCLAEGIRNWLNTIELREQVKELKAGSRKRRKRKPRIESDEPNEEEEERLIEEKVRSVNAESE